MMMTTVAADENVEDDGDADDDEDADADADDEGDDDLVILCSIPITGVRTPYDLLIRFEIPLKKITTLSSKLTVECHVSHTSSWRYSIIHNRG